MLLYFFILLQFPIITKLLFNIQSDTKNGNVWKTQQKLKKSKEKNWQKLNHYNLPFKRQ